MCWDCDSNKGGDPHSNFIRGGVDVDDFEKEVNYTPKPRKKKPRKKPRPGCPGNDMGEHIYIWSTETIPEDYLLFKFYGWHSVEWKTCCGCGKHIGSRPSERYLRFKERMWKKVYGGPENVKRGEPVQGRISYPSFKYWHPENYDPEFVEFKRDHINRNGYDNVFSGPWWWQ